MSIQLVDDTFDNDNGLDEDAAVEALMNLGKDSAAGKASTDESEEDEGDDAAEGTEGQEADEDEADDAEDEEESEDEDEEEEADAASKKSQGLEASDDHLVKVTVDGQELTVPVKDLKRLYGQEASLTRKSQELAALRKEADTMGSRAAAVLGEMLKEAKAEWEQYEEIDWMIAARRLDDESLAALRQEAKVARERFQKLLNTAKEVEDQKQTLTKKVTEEEIAKSVETLKAQVPDWSTELYAEVRKHAVEALGFDKDDIDNAIDPRVIIALHKARLYDLGQKTKPLTTKKINKTPKGVLKPGAQSGLEKLDGDSRKATKVMKKFQATGSEDDAVEALIARTASRKNR